MEGVMPPIFSKSQESWSKVNHAAREMVTVLSMNFFTTARNSGNILLTYWKAFFVRHSSEHKMLDSDQKVDWNIYPDGVTCDGICLIDP